MQAMVCGGIEGRVPVEGIGEQGMPTYEYECSKCGHAFERFQSMTEEPVKRCPKCRCKVRRLLGTGAGLIFKGSGFYTTDYRSEGYKSEQKKDSDSSSKESTASTSETKSSGDKKDGSGSKSKAKSDGKKPQKQVK